MKNINSMLNILPTVALFAGTALLLSIGVVYDAIESFMSKNSRKIQENVKIPNLGTETRFYKKPALY